ncbi:MAG: acetate--CoA ligase [Candidatus Nealsonbacteria bacterium]
MKKKSNLYYPNKKFKKRAWVRDKTIYKEANKNPIKFWNKIAKEVVWFKKPKKTFIHKPPCFKWFVGGKLNITQTALDRNLEERKNKVALIWEPEPTEEQSKILTYYDLYRKVNRFANALKRSGVKKGDRVGIYLPMLPEVVISMLACARIGAVHSVVFSAFSSRALRIRLQDTKAKILITADGYYRRSKIIDLKKNADEGIKETDVKKVVVVKRAKNPVKMKKGRDIWWQDLVEKESDDCEPVPMDSEDPLFILTESGTAGQYLQILHTTGGYTVQAYITGKWVFDFKDEDIFWCMADVGWATGHTYGIYSPLLNGVTFLIFEGAPDWPEPHRWAQIIEKYGVTTFYTAPTAIRMFEKYNGKISKKYKFESLRILGSVGEPINEATWHWYFQNVGKGRCPLVDTWWQTETGGILISSLPGIGPFKPAFTGLPFPGVRFDILDKKGNSLPVNKEGNLVMLPPFAPGLLRGIYKNPKKYKKTYWSQYGNKIYFTSDVAYKDKNGLIRIVGRVDDIIKVAGHRISTGELENILSKHSNVVECAVVGVPHEIKGEVPVVFVVLKKKMSLEKVKKELIKKIREEIGPIVKPKEIYLVEDLPKTRSGKIMRRILKRLFIAENLGDLSTLSNPESVKRIKQIIQKNEKKS